jgi:hemerythrin-like domain-containing protein
MSRKDWFYVNLPVEQGEVLDFIVDQEGRKYGMTDKHQLIRSVVSDFIEKYEAWKDLRIVRKAVRSPNKDDDDLQQPIS